MSTEMRKCKDCGLEKPIDRFGVKVNRNKTATIYRHPYCRECMVIRSRGWIEKNKEKYLEYHRQYHQKVRKAKQHENIG